MASLPERRPIIRGERVYLRPSERVDLPAFVRWLNDAEVARTISVRDVPVMSLLRYEWAAERRAAG